MFLNHLLDTFFDFILSGQFNQELGGQYHWNLQLSSVEHKRHYISEIEPIEISLPKHHKQNQIANILSGIDEKIKMESDIYTLLTRQKLYLLQNLFI
ncbi:MAG: hypothetical protein E2589_11465 [Chryseobacterium sp.]|nr:hypothetical protein [Chryseobacterium sp.]